MKLPDSHRQLYRFPQISGEEPSSSVLRLASPRSWMGSKSLARDCLQRLHLGIAATMLLGFALPASASLGGSSNSVETDRAQLNASRQITQLNAYAVHEITAPQGIVIDEYVSQAGKVFAVSWRGQFPPSMQQILGTYFQQYVDALKGQSRPGQPRVYGHRPLDIQLPGLVVQASSGLGAYSGRAYIPEMLPQGMTAAQIQ
jgi:hypothetical protein